MENIQEGILDKGKKIASGLMAGALLSVASPADAAPPKKTPSVSVTPESLNMVALPIDKNRLFEQLKIDEGVSKYVYVCPQGYKTVGIGFNLQADPKFSRQVITSFGIDYDRFSRIPDGKRYGEIGLTNEQVLKLFEYSLAKAIKETRELFPNFDYQPPLVKEALINMCFNLGKEGLSKFVRFRKHINDGLDSVVKGMGPPKNFAAFASASEHYKAAGIEMEDSQWWNQVGNRAKRLRKQIESAADIKSSFFYRKKN